jgi:hypothetical protein
MADKVTSRMKWAKEIVLQTNQRTKNRADSWDSDQNGFKLKGAYFLHSEFEKAIKQIRDK